MSATSAAASFLAIVAIVAIAPTAAARQDPVAELNRLLTGSEYSGEEVEKALKGAIDAGAAAAVPLLLEGIDRFGEALTKSEVEAARSEVEIEKRKDDSAAAEDERVSMEKARGTASKQHAVLEAIRAGLPNLLDAIAAKAAPGVVAALVDAYEQETKRVQELEAKDESQKGKLASFSSKLFGLDEDKERADQASRVRSEKAEMQARVDQTLLILDLHKATRTKLVDVIGTLLRTAKGPEIDAALKQLDKRVDGKAPAAERIVWVDLYARLGRENTPNELVDAAQRAGKEAKKHQDELAKLSERFNKAREAYFKSVNLKTGTGPRDVIENFNAMQKLVQDETLKQLERERLRSAASRTVGAAVATMPPDKRAKAVPVLLGWLATEKDLEIRCGMLESCGVLDEPSVRTALRKILVEDKDVKARLAALEALVTLKDADALEVARTRLMVHENWRVRTAAIAALVRVPQKESIPVLIRALSVEGGRVKEDANQALQTLTGQTFAMSAPAWQKWWDEQGASFRIDQVTPRSRVVAAWDQKGEGKVSFYGITSISKRVCFVLDVSRSMLDPMREGSDKSKFDVAKEQLTQAITAFADDDQFMIIVFAEDVARWQKNLTTATPANKQKAISWIEDKLELGPGTNIHAGMKEAFTVAGLGTRDTGYESQIDTIFFLSDGEASVGDVVDPMEIRREIRDWNRLSRLRIHTIGVGEDPNIGLLYGIAEDAQGQFQRR